MLTRLAVNAVSCCGAGAPAAFVLVARSGSGGTVLSWSNPPSTSTQSLGNGAADGYQRAYFWSDGSRGCVLSWTRGSQFAKDALMSDRLSGFSAKKVSPKGSAFQFSIVHDCERLTHCSDSGSKMFTLYNPLLLCMS